MYHFIPINGLLFHWAVSSPSYLSAFSGPIDSWAHLQHSVTYGPLLLVGQIQPVVTVARLRTVNTLGRFHVKKTRWAVFIELSNTAY